VAILAVVVALVAAPGVAARADVPSALAVGSSAVVSDAPTWLEGIDVSHWQGTISWPKVAAAGKKFAIIKVTESYDYTDPQYATNHAAARAAGLWTGGYHFAQPDATPGDAVREADYFVSKIVLGVGDLIPALDLEVTGGLSVAALQSWVFAWLNEVYARTGVRPMIYTSPNFWMNAMGNTSALADAGYKTLWIAHWGVTSPTIPANNWGGHGWTFWQYTSNGSVPGITGRVDLDRFNGADLTPAAFSIFKLAPQAATGSVKQGQSAAAIVKILRTNFTSGVALNVTGLPAGTTAAFNANPSTAASSTMTVTTPADPTVTPLGTYPLTISGVASGITRTTKMNLVVGDGIPPTLVAPSTSLVGGTLARSTTPVIVRWAASDPSGVAACALQRSVSGGTWSSLALPSATARLTWENLALGTVTQQRVRATDTKANTSPWSAGPLVRAAVIQENAVGMSYAGLWHTTLTTSASGGGVRYTTAPGASITYRFTGSSVAIVATRGVGRGGAWVYVDGKYAGSIFLGSSTAQYRAIVFVRNWSGNGTHTIRLVNAGSAGHARVDFDGLVRLSLG